MDNIVGQLNQILNDPDNMKQIMSMASALSGENIEDIQTNESVQIPGNIIQELQSMQKNERKQDALVRALLPYLRPGHRRRLEQAIKIASVSHLAGAALRTKEVQTEENEATHDV